MSLWFNTRDTIFDTVNQFASFDFESVGNPFNQPTFAEELMGASVEATNNRKASFKDEVEEVRKKRAQEQNAWNNYGSDFSAQDMFHDMSIGAFNTDPMPMRDKYDPWSLG